MISETAFCTMQEGKDVLEFLSASAAVVHSSSRFFEKSWRYSPDTAPDNDTAAEVTRVVMPKNDFKIRYEVFVSTRQ